MNDPKKAYYDHSVEGWTVGIDESGVYAYRGPVGMYDGKIGSALPLNFCRSARKGFRAAVQAQNVIIAEIEEGATDRRIQTIVRTA